VAPPPLPLTHPAVLITAAVAAVCIVASVSFRLADTDLWTLLAGGKAIWALHRVPLHDQWSWPGYGAPQVASSWLFRALLWPLWSSFGIAGLYAWRWVATLAAFGFIGAGARALGARGLLTPIVLVWGALVFRMRSEVRPELLAAVLFAAQLWILECRRAGGADRSRWIMALAWLWANAHASYPVGLLLTAIYLIAGNPAAARARLELAGVLGGSIALSFLNPSTWRALAQPFQFWLSWRNEPMFRAIEELEPLYLAAHWRSGLPVLIAGWPLLGLTRIVRRSGDAVEAILCAVTTVLVLGSSRFLGLYALAATPFVARDLEWLASALPRPSWTTRAGTRGAIAATACVVIALPEWTRIEIPFGIGFEPGVFPVAACDFIGAHGLRGRAFNHFQLGGYQAYRFWPDRERLPFMTTQPENSPRQIRDGYIAAIADSASWVALDRGFRFDYLLLARDVSPGERLEDVLDQDPGWAMVFADDAAEVMVRRAGPFAALADSFAYRVLPVSAEGRRRLVGACAVDSLLRRRAIAELEREAAGSPANGVAHRLLGMFAMMDGRRDQARVHLERALALQPLAPGIHPLLGMLALARGDTAEALREIRIERRLHGAAAAPGGP